MSKINALRIVNLNYNKNNSHIVDETLMMNGENTLIDLGNGGGKTVMIQQVLAQYLRAGNRDLGSRPYRDFFTDSRPTIIMTEWALDGGAGFVTVGMMVRKNQNPDSDEKLENINFIDEYKAGCERDIHNIPVVTKSGKTSAVKSFSNCRELFESYQKSTPFFKTFNMNDSRKAREYFDTLSTYGINKDEWILIKKICMEESGLSKLFDNAKTDKDLTKIWLLPTVEDKKDADGEKIRRIRGSIVDHIELCYRNKANLEREDAIMQFQTESEKILEKGNECIEAEKETVYASDKIVAYMENLNELLDEDNNALNEETTAIDSCKENLRSNLHQKHSAVYYKEDDKINALATDIHAAEEMIEEANSQFAFWTRTRNLLLCAEKQEAVDKAYGEFVEAKTALEVWKKDAQDIIPERDYLGYRIRCLLENEAADYENRIASSEKSVSEAETEKKNIRDEITRQNQIYNNAGKEKARADAAIETFDKEENKFNTDWNESLQKSITGFYIEEDTKAIEGNIEKAIASAEKSLTIAKGNLDTQRFILQEQMELIQKLERERTECEQNLSDAKKEKEVFDKELDERRTTLQYLGLGEDALYDTSRILQTADKKISELDAIIETLRIEYSGLSSKIQKMTTGKTAEIPSDFLALLKGLGIQPIQGLEWLKANDIPEERKHGLVNKYPFLYSALVMSGPELERLKAAGEDVYTSAPIPIVIKENLTDTQDQDQDKVISFGDVHFYTLFNKNLLDEEKLKAFLKDLNTELLEKAEVIKRRKLERDDYFTKRVRIEGQQVSGEAMSRVSAAIETLTNKISETEQKIAETKEEIEDIKNKATALENEIKSLTDAYNNALKKQTEFKQLMVGYESDYIGNLEASRKCATKQTDAAKKISLLTEKQTGLEDQASRLRNGLITLRTSLNDKKRQVTAFSMYTEIARPDGLTESDLGTIEKMKARFTAIADKLSGRERDLEANYKEKSENYEDHKQRLSLLAQKYEFACGEWSTTQFTQAESDHADDEIKAAQDRVQANKDQKADLETQKVRAEEKQNRAVEQMERDCGTTEPLPREQIRQTDFVQAEKTIRAQMQGHKDLADSLTKKITAIEKCLGMLTDFADAEATTPVVLSEDFSKLSDTDLRVYLDDLRRDYINKKKTEETKRAELASMIDTVSLNPVFKEPCFAIPFSETRRMLSDTSEAMERLERAVQGHQRKLEMLSPNLKIVDKTRTEIARITEEYVMMLHEEIRKIGEKSTIEVNGKPERMMVVEAPVWKENEAIYRARVDETIDTIVNRGLEELETEGLQNVEKIVNDRMTTVKLYDAVIGLGLVHSKIKKVEQCRVLTLPFNEVAKTSGAEKFVSSFVIFAALLDYIRRNDTDIVANKKDGRVLIMDNPFSQTYSDYMVKPVIDMAKRYNIQMISFTGMTDEAIYKSYDNVYSMRLVPYGNNGERRISARHEVGDEDRTLESSHLQVVEYEQQTLPFV